MLRKIIGLFYCVALAASIAVQAQDNVSMALRGSINGFAEAAMTYRSGFDSWIVTVQAGSANANAGFLFSPVGASFNPKWANGASVSLNTKSIWYDNGSDGIYNQTSGSYYTFISSDRPSGTNAEGYVFETSATPTSVTNVTQAPISSSVTAGQAVVVTATTGAALPSGQKVYLRYAPGGNYSSAVVLEMTYTSGNDYTATIPGTVNTAGSTQSYYVFTSGTNTPSNADADLATINLNNNGGSNYSYTVLNPSAVYVHNFDNPPPSSANYPYNVSPLTSTGTPTGVLATNLNNSSWTSSTGTFTNYGGASGQSMVIQPANGVASTISLSLTVASGYSLSITSYSFWRQRSSNNGPQISSITVNGTSITGATITAPLAGANTGNLNPSVALNGLSGNITIVLNLTATTAAGTNLRIDDFTLNGNVVALPGAASNSSDIIDNTSYATGSAEFNSNPSYILFTDGTATTAGKIIPMKFKIRDGGVMLNDADNLPTTLTGIAFNVTNTSGTNRINFIKQAILTTSGGTVIGTSSINASQIIFTGLTDAAFTVPDNSESASNLHLRVSFNEANVIDNEKLVFTVASATTGAGSSAFYYPNGGGAQTDNDNGNDRNRIEVIATALAFVQQPGNTGFGQTMTPNPTVQAIDANGKRDLDFANGIVLTSYGTMTGAPISVNAGSGLSTYTSVVHTAVQSGVQLTASYAGLTSVVSNPFNITVTAGTTDHFRTAAGFSTGNWNSTSTWESSPDNSTWVAATQIPNSAAGSVTIRTGTVTVSTSQSAKLLTIQAGAVLVHNAGTTFTIADDGSANHDIVVQGRYEINGEQPTLNSGATGIIYTNAEVRANDNFGSPGTSDDFARNTSISWQHNSLYNWNTTNAFETSAATYFPNTPEGTIPIFRISASTNAGAGGTTTINGILEIAGSATFTWNNAGDKVFRNGIQGSGTLIQNSGNCGRYVINGNTSVLGVTSWLSLRNNPGSGIVIQSGVCTILNNTITNSGPVSVSNGSTLVAGTYVMSGSASFTLNAGATFSSAHVNGVNGNITVTDTKSFVSGSNYIFNGSVNQTTGTLMAGTVGSLTINNSGTASNNFVALSNNNTTATTFNMQAGIFRAGSGNTLRIAAGGTVNGSGGHVSTDVNGEGGTIQMLGAGNITGTPRLWIVAIGNSGTGVSFTNNAPIYHQCIIGSNGFVTNAPTYQSGSTLIYRTNGTYARNVEWGNTAGLPGYPHHVTVDGNTIVDLFTNSITPATLAIGGNLQLGSSNGYGRMYLNNNMNKPLEVLGDVTIGNGIAAANTSVLALEDSQPGGDLILHGNYTRHIGSIFSGYNRAVFLRGSNNSSIRVLPPQPASSGTTIDEIFPYVFVQKSNPDAEITMNCTVGVNDQLDLTGNGLITSTTGNYLVIINKNSDAIIGGSATSFVNGPLIRRTASTPNNYHYPVGKKTGTGRVYRPLRFSTMNNLGNGDEFTGEYFSFTDATPSAGQDDLFGSTIGGILKNEYWQFDRIPSSIATGKLAITYQFPGTTGEWRDAAGGDSPPCADCNVAVVKRSTNAGNSGNWYFTKTDNNFDDISTDYPEARYYNQSGFIQSGELSSFSPFTIGFNFNTILGTLPVKLLAFNGSMQLQKANLQWQIDSDKDVLHFELQHSTNGTAFTTVHTLLPAGNTYSSNHLVSMPGRHFYRLKVKEKNGRSFYSKVVVLVAGNSATFISGMQSTVVSQQAVVNLWSQQNQTAQTSLYDASGKLLAQQQQQLLRGDNQLKVAAQPLPKGIYFLQVQTADGVRQTLRWLKQ